MCLGRPGHPAPLGRPVRRTTLTLLALLIAVILALRLAMTTLLAAP